MKLISKVLMVVVITGIFTGASAAPSSPTIDFSIVPEAGHALSTAKNALTLSDADIDCVRLKKHVNKTKDIEFYLFNKKYSSPNPDFGKVSYVFSVDLTQAGGDKLEKFTEAHKGESLKTSVGAQTLSTATIQGPMGRYFQMSALQQSVFDKLKQRFANKLCQADPKKMS